MANVLRMYLCHDIATVICTPTRILPPQLELIASIFVGAFAFEVAFEEGANALWDSWNKGRQWKDIRSKYIQE
ncbi:hypothetical protein BCR33DRAFT_779443 [Rhizoclosmatium globosum]|uniref:Complex III subunit 9 n=1 Tax=Rhizoclosmatium globosum TaxID=329046 RepID=A0A1Y2D1U0_9FUNG|nr:hypothetical protein BCR33DRAFT_779443 [Rhizoclosmatium globosum]|eukprot:ORY53094.1 hypothetical protein BCR33DRAFT_779443 [Rhizoclosmatium globosum]